MSDKDIHDINFPVISGAKGSKGGGEAKASKEDPNTLRSRATVKVIDFISQGEIFGLVDRVNPLKSVYFDDTPVQSADGSYNFANVLMTERVGTPGQTYVAGFPQANAPFTVGVALEGPSNYVELWGPPLTRTIQNQFDAAVVTIGVGALNKIDKTTGDIHGSSVHFKIERRTTGSSVWQLAYEDTIVGKTMTPYERDYRVERPAYTGQFLPSWEIRVTRSTPKSTDSTLANSTAWNRYVGIRDVKLAYPNWAYAALAVDSESTGGAVPKRSYDIKGMLVKVPSNYNPDTREYTGLWNGTFKIAWTDNPAWCVYDMLTNTRYGMGEFVKESMLDKWSFYRAAVYNDQIIPYKYTNSNGIQITANTPRFRMNLPISTQVDAWKLVQSMASNCQSFIGEAGGLIALIQDSPKDPVKNVTRANVIDGKFSYSSTSMLARHNRVNITFTDIEDGYLPHTVTEDLPAAIAKYGMNSTDVVAYGVIDEAQARRQARTILETENTANRVVTYQAAWDHVDTIPGDIVNVMDPMISGYEWGGRVATATTNEITLDRVVEFAQGAHSIVVTLADGSLLGADPAQPINILSNKVVDGKTVVTVPNLASIPPVEAVWVIKGPVVPQQYRIVSQKEDSPGLFSITGLLHDPTKYARIEQGIIQKPPTYYDPNTGAPSLPTNLKVSEESYTDSVETRRRLRLTWATKAADFITNHAVKWSVDDKPFHSVLDVSQPEFVIDSATPGTYTFLVTTYNLVGVASPTAQIKYTFNTGENGTDVPVGSSVRAPINIGAKNGAQRNTTFWTDPVMVEWDNHPDNINLTNGVTQPVDHYILEFLSATENFVFKKVETSATSFPLSMAENALANGGLPVSKFRVRLYAIDAMGKKSPASALVTLSAPVMSAPENVGIGKGPNRGVIFLDENVDIQWDNPAGNVNPVTGKNIVVSYEIQFRDPNTDALWHRATVTEPRYLLTMAENMAINNGTPRSKFKVTVFARDQYGTLSPPSATVTLAAPPVYPPINIGVDQKGTTVRASTFFTKDVKIAWDENPENMLEGKSVVRDYMIEFRRIGTNEVFFQVLSIPGKEFTLTYALNAAKNAGVAKGDFNVVMWARNNFGALSPPSTSLTMTVLRLNFPTNLLVEGGSWRTPDLNMSFSGLAPAPASVDQTELDIFAGYEVRVFDTESNTQRYTTVVKVNRFTYSFDTNKSNSGVGKPADPTLTIKLRTLNLYPEGNSPDTQIDLEAEKPPAVADLMALPNGGTLFNTRDLSTTWSATFFGTPYEFSPMFVGYRITADAANLPPNKEVRAATTTNITLNAHQMIDGVQTTDGDWILVKNQQNPVANGIYAAYPGLWQRVSDYNEPGEFTQALFTVRSGAGSQGGKSYMVDGTVAVVGESPIIFVDYGTRVKNRVRMVTGSLDTYLFTQNQEDNGGIAAREIRIRVKAIDVFERAGGEASASFLNPAPSAPGVTTQNGYYTTFFTMIPPNDPDIAGYIVRMSEVNGVNPYERPVVYEGSDNFFNVRVEPGRTYYYTAACYDVFGKQQVNWTSQRSFSSMKEITDTEFVFSGLDFLPNKAANVVTWSAGTVNNPKTNETVAIVGGSAQWTGGQLFIYHRYPETSLRSSTALTEVFSNDDSTLVAVYRGGTDVNAHQGKAFMDGGYILGQTIGAAQLITNQAVITGTAQIANGIITEAAIGDAQITNAKIVNATIDTLKLKNGAITQITAASFPIWTAPGTSGYFPANQVPPKDSGWQTIGTQVFQNPPLSAGAVLSGNAQAFFGFNAKMQVGSNSSSSAFFKDMYDNAGTVAYRLRLEALDMNDGIWYEQARNGNFDSLYASGETTGPWNSDARIMFNGAIVFKTIQFASPGSAGVSTIQQGTMYRAGQFFRLSIQVRTSIYNNIYYKGDFTAPSGQVGHINLPGQSSLPYSWDMKWNVSTGTIATGGPYHATQIPVLRAESPYLVVTQIFK